MLILELSFHAMNLVGSILPPSSPNAPSVSIIVAIPSSSHSIIEPKLRQPGLVGVVETPLNSPGNGTEKSVCEGVTAKNKMTLMMLYACYMKILV